MFQVPAPAENPLKFQQITRIPCSSPTKSANHVKFAPFVNLLYIMFQATAPTENPQEFQQIMQISRSSSTKSANYAKFAPIVNLLYVMFQRPTRARELPKIPANQAKFD